MAIVTSTAGFLYSTRTHSNTDFTAMFNVYVRSIAGDYSIFYGFNGSNNPSLGLSGSGDRFALEDNAVERLGSTVLTANTWYHACWYRVSGTDFLEVDGVDQGVGSVGTGSGAADTFIGIFPDGINYNIGATRLDGIKIWNTVLTAAERQRERYSIKPVRWSNLFAWLPCNVGGVIGSDWSGNGDWSITGTPTLEAPAPVSWGDPPIFIPQLATSAPIYYAAPLGLLAC